jgi:hypothetical protein
MNNKKSPRGGAGQESTPTANKEPVYHTCNCTKCGC